MDGSRKERMIGRFDLRVTDLDTVTLMITVIVLTYME